ncbi:MAG: hypothetical protein K0R18_296 [Bacillales bacterium]|jgi:hypothetical protein|nr:hypothetical protein [Bacillales bacterium]
MRNLDFELQNYFLSEETKTIRRIPDSEFHGRLPDESLFAQFETEEDCEQFENAVARLRPDLKVVIV